MDKISETNMMNEMLCTILSEVQALRYDTQQQRQVIEALYNQTQGISNDVLQLRLQQTSVLPNFPSQPSPANNENRLPAKTDLWDKRDTEFPEQTLTRPKPSFKIPNR